jgi:hypothetical protein
MPGAHERAGRLERETELFLYRVTSAARIALSAAWAELKSLQRKCWRMK